MNLYIKNNEILHQKIIFPWPSRASFPRTAESGPWILGGTPSAFCISQYRCGRPLSFCLANSAGAFIRATAHRAACARAVPCGKGQFGLWAARSLASAIGAARINSRCFICFIGWWKSGASQTSFLGKEKKKNTYLKFATVPYQTANFPPSKRGLITNTYKTQFHS